MSVTGVGPPALQCAGQVLSLERPVVMGILNVTPDSFSDGGRYSTPERALTAAARMVEEGAAIIDIGGESTRPGATPVESEEELRRVLPVVEQVAAQLPVIVCVDTSNPQLMRRAEASGAQMINDVRAARVPGALEALASGRMALCLMHMQGEPANMQRDPRYRDVVAEVAEFLCLRVRAAIAAGIAPERLCIDPGFGFGKLLRHNLQLLAHLARLTALGPPLLVGLSRKSMADALVADALVADAAGARGAPHERLAASLALATIAVLNGARIVRAHDVAGTVDAVRVAAAIAAEAGAEAGAEDEEA
jgi:dihydropteroate synthase